jgi:plasmid stabilization system protein ParE
MDKMLVAEAAEQFEAEFAKALEAIAAHPERYPLCDDRHRFFLRFIRNECAQGGSLPQRGGTCQPGAE